jgi:hypothetical protein
MSLILSGSDGLSDIDGSASTPAIRGTDANTGIFFPAADTIAFAEGGVESARFDASGNMGLAVTPSAWKSNYKAFQVGNATAVVGRTDNNNNYFSSNWFVNSSNQDIYQNTGFATIYAQNAGNHAWYTAASGTAGNAITFTEAMRIDSSGNVLVGITSARANAGDVQVSKGISFPATQSAQSDANTLDDYEEGTWTPVLGGSTSETGQTYTRQLGRYTKVGRQVTVTWDVIISTVGTMVGNGHLKGLPFTVGNNVGSRAGLALGEFSSLATAVSIFSGIVVENTTELYIRVATASTATGVASITATSLWGNGTQLIGTITYFV